MGLRVWSGGEIFGKKIRTLWGAHKAPPPIKTKVKGGKLKKAGFRTVQFSLGGG